MARGQFAVEVRRNQTILPQFNLHRLLAKSFKHAAFCRTFSQKFWMRCILQRLLSKSFGRNARCSMLSQKFSASCILQDVLSKVLDPLQFAAALPQKLWLQCSVQHLAAKWFGSAASGGEYFSFGLML